MDEQKKKTWNLTDKELNDIFESVYFEKERNWKGESVYARLDGIKDWIIELENFYPLPDRPEKVNYELYLLKIAKEELESLVEHENDLLTEQLGKIESEKVIDSKELKSVSHKILLLETLKIFDHLETDPALNGYNHKKNIVTLLHGLLGGNRSTISRAYSHLKYERERRNEIVNSKSARIVNDILEKAGLEIRVNED